MQGEETDLEDHQVEDLVKRGFCEYVTPPQRDQPTPGFHEPLDDDEPDPTPDFKTKSKAKE